MIDNENYTYVQDDDHPWALLVTPKEKFKSIDRDTLSQKIEMAVREERKRIMDILAPYEWSGFHTDYDDSWAVMTHACPFCFNAKVDGHKPGCIFIRLREGNG